MAQELMNEDYKDFIGEIKNKIRNSQYEAMKQVNRTLINLYWGIGQEIYNQQQEKGWGKSIVELLSKELKKEFPDVHGFSARNLWRMRNLYVEYKDNEILPPLVAEISWSKNVVIMEKCKALLEREFYIKMTRKYGWTKDVLINHIENKTYEKYLINQTNFDETLPEKYVNQAKLAVKDEYIFDFMNNNKKLIKDLLYLNNEVKSVREALAIKEEIIFEPSLTFINSKIFNTFNDIYYRKNIKNYSNNYLLNYDLYKRIIDDKNKLKSPIELAFLAYSYLKVRDLNQAKLIFQRSLRINPKNNFAKHYLGVILIKENNPLGLNLLIESYETNPNYLESSLKLIDEYNIRNALNYTKNSTNLNSISLIKERLDFIESHELTTNSKVISSTLNEDIINLIKNDAQKFKYVKEIKTFTQVLDNYEKHYISILFTKESKAVDKTIVFYIFYYLLNNLDLPINTNNFFLYELKYPKKKYDIYSTYFNSKISTIIYQKEEL